MNEAIDIREAPGKAPLCPHCEREVRTLHARKVK
jgi:hypothetical protein